MPEWVDGPGGYTGVVSHRRMGGGGAAGSPAPATPLCSPTTTRLPAIQDVADHVGDSAGTVSDRRRGRLRRIVFCGVHFMAETAKILSPNKRVRSPDAAPAAARRLHHRRRTARMEGRVPRRRRRVVRQHHRRGVKGLTDICCNLVQRRRGSWRRSTRTRMCCSCPTSSSVRTSSARPAATTSTSGRVNATSTPASHDELTGAGRVAPRRRPVHPPRCGCNIGSVPWQEGFVPAERSRSCPPAA